MDTSSSAPAPAGFMGSLRSLCDGLLATGARRLELFSLELREEKLRLIQVFMWISAVVFTGMMAITFASLVLVYLFWENARLFVLGGLALLYTGAFLGLLIAFRRYLARQPAPFDATLEELSEDRACIRTEN
jgi:uncharacterized membrane protein YqjE